MVCRNICKRIYHKIVVGESHYLVGVALCIFERCHYFLFSYFLILKNI
jgi:pimeloyl-ACP methyl ester carboxylesterase